ncbi:AAA family ATPase, partial [Elusimicrobiota bacterium]
QNALDAINFLKNDNLPPLTFILKNLIPKVNIGDSIFSQIEGAAGDIIRYFLGNMRIDSELVWHSECILSGGGENPQKVERIIGLEMEIEDIEAKLNKSEEKSSNMKKEKNEIQDKLQSLISMRNDMQAQISPLREKVGQLTGNYNYLCNEIGSVKDRMKMVGSEEEMKSNLEKVNADIAELRKSLDELKKSQKEKSQCISVLTEDIAKVNARRLSLEEVINTERENIKTVQNQLQHLNDDVGGLRKVIADLEYKKKLQAEQNTNDIGEVSVLSASKKEEMKKLGELENEKGSIIHQLNGLKEEQKKLDRQLNSLKDTVGEQRQTEERLKEKIDNIKERLAEDMDIEIQEALKNYSPDPVEESKIQDLKRKLEKVGEVNLEAPKEYEKEHQRFEFIKKHVDDLESASEDLKSIIRKIKKQTHDKFIDTFNRVNENFSRIFRKLFEGGHSRLRLVDPDNILESGIEIEATPEGKNVSSIIQFSGGESALCAIALMFAIYEVKPTPFCILDEVDSPLDESNLHRFLRMLRDYTEHTQFIIVTHNKNTMEMSDAFYGITMEEFGVSKTISVKLKETKTA